MSKRPPYEYPAAESIGDLIPKRVPVVNSEKLKAWFLLKQELEDALSAKRAAIALPSSMEKITRLREEVTRLTALEQAAWKELVVAGSGSN